MVPSTRLGTVRCSGRRSIAIQRPVHSFTGESASAGMAFHEDVLDRCAPEREEAPEQSRRRSNQDHIVGLVRPAGRTCERHIAGLTLLDTGDREAQEFVEAHLVRSTPHGRPERRTVSVPALVRESHAAFDDTGPGPHRAGRNRTLPNATRRGRQVAPFGNRYPQRPHLSSSLRPHRAGQQTHYPCHTYSPSSMPFGPPPMAATCRMSP
jgi:hypothetical protein